MCRVLLADGEAVVLNQLESIIKNKHHEECDIFYAQRGREVVEKADSLKPDMIFLDIHLPGLNGIQVMEEIRSFDSNVIFIVLTDCQSFTYAKEAMGQQVMEYLLKPIEPDKVLAALDKAIAKVSRGRSNRAKNKKIHEKLDIVTPMIEGEFIKALIFQANLVSHVNIYKGILNIQERYGFVMILQFENANCDSLVEEITEEEFRNIKRTIRESFPAVIGNQMNGKIVSFIPWNQSEYWGIDSEVYREKAFQVRNNICLPDEKTCRLGVGELHALERCAESYSEALEELEQKGSAAENRESFDSNKNTVKIQNVEMEKELMGAVEVCNIDEIHRISKKLFDQIDYVTDHNIEEMKINLLSVIMLMENKILPPPKQENSLYCRTGYLKEIQLKKTKEQLYEWMMEKLLSVCYCIEKSSEEKNMQIITNVKKYIDQNYGRNLSLESAAESAGVSLYYLSKLFKANTGENFIDYVTHVRIKQAKILLKQKKLSIDEVSIRCGYKNPAYFSRVFKRYMKMTPSMYRRIADD